MEDSILISKILGFESKKSTNKNKNPRNLIFMMSKEKIATQKVTF